MGGRNKTGSSVSHKNGKTAKGKKHRGAETKDKKDLNSHPLLNRKNIGYGFFIIGLGNCKHACLF